MLVCHQDPISDAKSKKLISSHGAVMSGKKPVLTKTPVWQALAVLGWARDIFLAEVLPPGAKDIKACELHCKVRCDWACRIAGLGSERLAEFGNFFFGFCSFSLSLISFPSSRPTERRGFG